MALKVGTAEVVKIYQGTTEVENLAIGGTEIPDIPTPTPVVQPDNEIWYTSTDGGVVNPYMNDFGANVVSNLYSEGKGILKFDGDVTKFGNFVYGNISRLVTISIPNKVTSIGASNYNNADLTGVTIPSSVTSIGESAFEGSSSLNTIIFAGTIAQWNAIDKNPSWKNGIAATVAHCSNGDVLL